MFTEILNPLLTLPLGEHIFTADLTSTQTSQITFKQTFTVNLTSTQTSQITFEQIFTVNLTSTQTSQITVYLDDQSIFIITKKERVSQLVGAFSPVNNKGYNQG